MTAVDTAYNYHHFGAHRMLAGAAGELLDGFEVSTKVGFFPGLEAARHFLDPARLREAMWRTVDDLGVRPAVVLLHNPERTLRAVTPWHGHELLATACAVLAEAASSGLVQRWGVSCWDPGPVLAALRQGTGCPVPQVLMTRAGLTLTGSQLGEAEQLGDRFGVAAGDRWGMSPFAGRADHPVWARTDLSTCFEGDEAATAIQAAFRLAFELPAVSRVAVGTGNKDHLHQLVNALDLSVVPAQVLRYRQLVAAAPATEARST